MTAGTDMQQLVFRKTHGTCGMSLSLHFEYISNQDDVWLATCEQIAAAFAAKIKP